MEMEWEKANADIQGKDKIHKGHNVYINLNTKSGTHEKTLFIF